MDETNRLLGLQDETGKGSENSDTQKGKYMIFKSGPASSLCTLCKSSQETETVFELCRK